MQSFKYDEILAKYLECQTWLESLGIASDDRPRFSKLRAFIENLILKTGQKMEQKHIIPYYENMLDCYTFIDLHNFLHKKSITPELLGKIRQACRMRSIHEKDSQFARNHLFELELAAFFHSNGHEIVSFDDIAIRSDQYTIHIECKRPNSVKQVPKNITEAYRKLKDKYSDSNSRGIIALGLDRLTNPDGSFGGTRNLTNTVAHFENETQCYQAAMQFSNLFNNRFRDCWSWMVDPKLIAIIQVFKFVSKHNDVDRLAFIPVIVPLSGGRNLQFESQIILMRLTEKRDI